MAMTVREHDDAYLNSAYAIQKMSKHLEELCAHLRYANALTCIKELHAIGRVCDDEYEEELLWMLTKCGFITNKSKEKES